MMKKIFRAVLCAALVLMMISGPACAEAAPAEKKVTVMVYMCGADLELMSRGTSTISEMYSARFSQDDINVIALCGGTRKWACGLDANVLSVVDVGKGGRRSVSVAEELPLASMGQPETLANFLALCKEKYPAERYDLVLWDHGGGPVGGVCWDAKFGEDQLTTAEVAAGLAASPFADRGLDLILMHACLMASAEFAFQVAPYAKYYVASQDSQFGLTYDWLKGMESEDSLETAKKVVDGSFESNTAAIERQAASEVNSFAVIDLTKMQALRDAVNDFFAVLPAQMDVEELTVMSRQRRDSQAFGLGESGGDSDFDLVDLGDLIRHCADIAPEKAEAVLAAIGEAVVYRRSVNENCSGLTIFHPYRNKKYAAKRMEIYETLSFPESYTGYLRQFMAYLNDNPKANWVGLETETPAATKDARTGFILPLTEEQAGQYADSALVGLEKTGEDSYSFRYLSRSTSLEGATVTGEYVRNGVYPAGAEGALAEAVT